MGNAISTHTRLNGPVWFIVKFLLVFLYIYEFNFTAFGLPTYVTSRRLSVLAVVLLSAIIVFVRGGKYDKIKSLNYEDFRSYKKMIWLHVFLFIYAFFLMYTIGRGTGDHIIAFIIKFFLLGLLPVWGFVQLFNTLDEFMKVLLFCSIVQSVVILLCLVNPALGEVIDTIFVQQGAIDHRYGYAGGIACITAPGLFRFTSGIIASVYFTLQKKTSVIYLALFLFLSFIGVMIARTGLVIFLIGVIVILRNKKGGQTGGVVKVVAVGIALLLIGSFIFRQVDFLSLFDFNRLADLNKGGTRGFFQGYFAGETTVIPPISYETLIGTGITSGTSGNGITVIVDGGYLRLYVAYGLFLAVLFYTVFFMNVIKVSKSMDTLYVRQTFVFFVWVFLIAEYKEFSIYEQYLVGLFYTMAFLCNKNNSELSMQ